jgi:hypothetical protein
MIGLAVLGHVGEPVRDGSSNGAHVDLTPVEARAPRDVVAVGATEQAHGEFGPSRAHEAGDADDLAAADIEVDPLHHLPVGMDRVVGGPVLHLEQLFPDMGFASGVTVRHFATDHPLDDPILADLLTMAIEGLDCRAVTQDGDRIRHLRNLVELVRDEDGGDALRLELQQKRQERVAVALVQARGRLIQNQELHLLR